MNEKKEILDTVLTQILKRKDSLKDSIMRCQDEIDHAPGPMESHSDTTRFQVGQLVSNLSLQLEKLEKAEVIMRGASNIDSGGIISIGSVAELDVDGKNTFIFIVPDGAGGLTVDGDVKISIVSEKSPMSLAILGKKMGDLASFKINGKEKKIKILNL
jgi:transcription elongation GreA/GreB family factor